jgi:hypothetical protein
VITDAFHINLGCQMINLFKLTMLPFSLASSNALFDDPKYFNLAEYVLGHNWLHTEQYNH